MKMIDKEKLLNIFLKWRKTDIELHGEELEWEPSLVLRAINEAPEVDPLPVVRCKNCKYYNTIGCSKGFGWCESMDRGVSDDFYCANGKQLKLELEAPLEEEL